MFKFGSAQTLGQASASVRMDSTMGVRSQREREVDKPLGSSIEWAGFTDGGAELLKRGPDIGVFLCNMLRIGRQGDRRILGELSWR